MYFMYFGCYNLTKLKGNFLDQGNKRCGNQVTGLVGIGHGITSVMSVPKSFCFSSSLFRKKL